MASDKPSGPYMRMFISKAGWGVSRVGAALALFVSPTFAANGDWLEALTVFSSGVLMWDNFRDIDQEMEAVVDD